MKTLSISGKTRAKTGTKDAIKSRKNGDVPCVLYGGSENLNFSVNEKQFAKLLYTPDAYLVSLDIDGKQAKAIVQESQFHKISDKILHVDFMEAVPGKLLTVKIPVVTHGSPIGVKKGGKLQTKIRRLTVKGLVDDLPDHITIEVAHLELGESILIKEMKNDKLKFLDPQNAAVVTVRTTREAEAPAATTTAAAPGAAAPAAAAAAPAAAAKKDDKPAAKK
ncbi:MAG TPA: 50S ribosomal protein L25 [Bacteroidia bacterium]|jgi:large subunit ribosomal protein L25|nr:50S ribosomal protein L25 [Bacteroidia bacterium]